MQLKSLKDKAIQQRGEARRREERLTEAETKLRRLEEALQGVTEGLKQSEDANKALKAQVRAAKQKQKAAGEAGVLAQPTADAPPQSASKNSLTPVRAQEKPLEPTTAPLPKEELALLTLIGQREKLCRDDLTAMLLAGEESLRMLIKEPSE